MNGNITKDGIGKDLAWMKRVGIAGVQNFDINLVTPQIVQKRLVYMSPAWKDAFRFAVTSANEEGLDFAIASSPGWSETGGPWVPPQDGMKKIAWSETVVTGGHRFAGVLPPPVRVSGPFQDIQVIDPLADLAADKKPPPPTYYSDAAVFAFPVRVAAAAPPLRPQIRLNGQQLLDSALLLDNQFGTSIDVPFGTEDDPAVISLDYDAPQTFSSMCFYSPGAADSPDAAAAAVLPELQASADDGTWHKVADIILSSVPTTASFAPVTAKSFRVILRRGASQAPAWLYVPKGVDAGDAFVEPKTFRVAELRLSGEAKINQWEAKAGFAVAPDYYRLDGEVGPDVAGVPPADVIDLTNRMRPDGTLNWTPPAGTWRIVRMGYSLTGRINNPATAEATGLEVDKLDSAAVRRYLEHYIAMYRATVGPQRIGHAGVGALLTDSTEVRAFNWTPRMIERFRRLRGYDPRPWLPTLTGTIVGSRSQSDRFLYDFRRTLSELHASEHYGTVARVAHENGLKVYGEALESARSTLGDDLDMRRYTDVPMAALWAYPREKGPTPSLIADMRGAASVAHLYGQNRVAAESMTSAYMPWAYAPADLRRVIDLEFASGVNLPVIHESAHQPVDDKEPGLSLFIFGQFFNRHETWAEMARPWIDYIARNSYMLQEGRFVADVAYFYGEEAPIVGQAVHGYFKDVPSRYAYDFVNPAVLNDVLKVDATGDLVAKSGARYRVLYLGGTSRRMTLATLRRMAALATQGATIVGDAPIGSPALADDQWQYRALVRRLWSGRSETRVGKGRVFAGQDVESALASIGTMPDFEISRSQPDTEILFVHRRIDGSDIYYVDNRRNRPEHVEISFRVAGKAPEIWRADSGLIEPASYRIVGGRTEVPLTFGPEESYFVVFRTPAKTASRAIPRKEPIPLATIAGPWTVQFEPGRGAPGSVTLNQLKSLSESSNTGVRYFSGVAAYSTSFDVPTQYRAGGPLLIDLGRVGDVAEVRVNGKSVGTPWHAPYRADIGSAVRPGRNQLEVRVANLWVNRLIGDAQPGAAKIAYTTIPTFKADAPLRPSGLIGPVLLLGEQQKAQRQESSP